MLRGEAADDVILACILIKLRLRPAQVTPARPEKRDRGTCGTQGPENGTAKPQAMAGYGCSRDHHLGAVAAKRPEHQQQKRRGQQQACQHLGNATRDHKAQQHHDKIQQHIARIAAKA